MKESKKDILDKIAKQSKKDTKFESLILNRALQRLDNDENFDVVDKFVYTADHKRLVYILGDDETVTIEEGVEVIGEMAATKKRNLKMLNFPSTLRKIEKDAFTDCDRLTQLSIPASVEEIEAYAFGDCDGLKSVFFEQLPKLVNRNAFAECDHLRDISVPSESVKTLRKMLHFTSGDTDYIVVGRGEYVKPVKNKTSKNEEKKTKEGKKQEHKDEKKKEGKGADKEKKEKGSKKGKSDNKPLNDKR